MKKKTLKNIASYEENGKTYFIFNNSGTGYLPITDVLPITNMEHTPKEEEILEAWLKKHRKDGQYIDGGNNYVEYSLDGCFNLHALVSSIRREAIAEEKRRIKKIIKWVYQNAKENHICRFNDGDCNCECYYTAINDILVHLTQE